MLLRNKCVACWCLLLAILFAAADVKATEPKAPDSAPAAIAEQPEASAALSYLQEAQKKDENTFVIQSDINFLIAPDGGGACASAAAIDMLQTLRVMSGLEKLANPHKTVLQAFNNQTDLLKGRVTNDEMVRLIGFYERYLDGAKLQVNIESAPNSTHADNNRGWTKPDGPNLNVNPRELKIVSFTWTSEGKILGRHFVLLKDERRNEIVVVDPAKPHKDLRYVLDSRLNDKGNCEQVFLLNPAGAPARADIFEINTIFTVVLRCEAGTPRSQSTCAQSIEEVKDGITATAKDLRGTKDFTSPREWRERTARFGLPGLDLPVERGGSDWPATKMIEVFRHAGAINLNFRDVVGGGHVRALRKSASPEIQKIVEQVAEGHGYVAIAITEPDIGSDVPAIKSTSRKVDGGYRLSGVKRFNARLEQATHVIIFTQGTTGVPGKLSVFVVPIDMSGLGVDHLSAHGLTGNSFGGLTFEDMFVPNSALVGTDGGGSRVFFEHFLYWRLMQAAAAIGTGENALQQMAARIKTRQAFGGPIGRFTHLQQPIGEFTTELHMAFALAREAAELIDQGNYEDANRANICGLKAESVEIALKAVDAATRAFGGEGYSHLIDLGDRLRDLNGLRIADGTTDVMRMEVVRHTFGEDFWEMAVQKQD
jgi:alkylation response protein AidB-like acyl-CoA dehydrogenase